MRRTERGVEILSKEKILPLKRFFLESFENKKRIIKRNSHLGEILGFRNRYI